MLYIIHYFLGEIKWEYLRIKLPKLKAVLDVQMPITEELRSQLYLSVLIVVKRSCRIEYALIADFMVVNKTGVR